MYVRPGNKLGMNEKRKGYAAENLATLRRWALNLIKADDKRKSAASKDE